MSKQRNPSDQPPRVALYARVSSDMQVEGKSIDAQLTEMREYAQRQGWQIVDEFVDAGFSAKSTNRPEFQRMMQDMEMRRFDIILVHDLSRLSRNLYDVFDIFAKLGRYNVGFASVKEKEFDYTKPHDRFVLQMLSLLNQYYIDLLKEHVKKSKRQRVRQGLHNASIPPFGYQRADSPDEPFEINPQEAEIVRFIFERYATKRYSMQEIADELYRRGYRTRGRWAHRKKRQGAESEALESDPYRFTADGVRDILHNRFYIGEVVYGYRDKDPEVYPGRHEPIISRELWEQTREALQVRRAKARAYAKGGHIYPLAGIVYCAICGVPLRAQAASKHLRYYREMSHKRGVHCPNNNIGADASRVENQVGFIFKHLTLPLDWQEEVKQYLDLEEEWVRIEQERQKLEKELERLRHLYRMGAYDHLEDKDERFQAELRTVQERLKSLPVADPMAIQEAANALILMRDIWDEATLEEKRGLIHDSLRRIDLDVAEPIITAIYPYPEFLPLFNQISFLRPLANGGYAFRFTDETETAQFGIPTWQAENSAPNDWLAFPYLSQWRERRVKNQRITPALSHELRQIRKAGVKPIRILDVTQPGYPPFLLDKRKWPEAEMETISMEEISEALSDLPAHSLHVLHTPFPSLQGDNFETLARTVARALAPQGRWLLTFLDIHQMPSHWVNEAFPDFWEIQKARQLSRLDMSRILDSMDLRMIVKHSRQTIFQSVSREAALAVAQRMAAERTIDPANLTVLQKHLEPEGKRQLPSLFVVLKTRVVWKG